MANNRCTDVIEVLSELFTNALLPADRKLLTFQLRGADWKSLKKNPKLDQKTKNQILAYWHFESDLKEHYFNFLKNIQATLQSGQENVKCKSILCVAKLLCYGPEKEQILLSMLINKLGDPVNKVAGKALYHLQEVAYRHPNMCGVITTETEKLLFRSNINEKAQHYALCFLAQIAARADADVCTKLVKICFSFFKVLVEKGEVNNKIMRAILMCIRRAIVEAKIDTTAGDETAVIPKETLDTIYRVVHIADIQIALQAICLLLQVMTVKSGKYDRFYNALYQKFLDPSLASIGYRQASLLFYIVHRSIFLDKLVPRCKAMIKRVLQMALYFPPAKICAVLVVVDKLLKARPDLRDSPTENLVRQQVKENHAKTDDLLKNMAKKYDSDGDDDDDSDDSDDKSAETGEKKVKSSWVHINLKSNSSENSGKKSSVVINKDNRAKVYDLKARNPAFAGAEYAILHELHKFAEHYHPTVQVFATNLISGKPFNYNGDPLRDFSLTHFLDRFAFRNPKTVTKSDESKTFLHKLYRDEKEYRPRGSRSMPVKSLTARNCTEDEKYIFEFLESQRARKAALVVAAVAKTDDDEDAVGDVDDDEFDAYLDSLGAEKDDVDFLNEISGDMAKEDAAAKRKPKKNRPSDNDDDDEDIDYFSDDDDEGVEDDDAEDHVGLEKRIKKTKTDFDEDEFDSNSEGSVSLDGGDDDDDNLGADLSDDDASVLTFSEDDGDDDENEIDEGEENDDSDDDEPTPKKSKLSKNKKSGVSSKEFNRAMKHSDNMSSLFAAADDFSQILEESGKSKGHGSLGEVFNKDKASVKQMDWEERRHNNQTDWKNKKRFGSGGRGEKNGKWKNGKTKSFGKAKGGGGFGKKTNFAGKKRKL